MALRFRPVRTGKRATLPGHAAVAPGSGIGSLGIGPGIAGADALVVPAAPAGRMSIRRIVAACRARADLGAAVILALYGALLVMVGYQVPLVHTINVAADARGLTGFYDREETPNLVYRWTGDEGTIQLPALPRGQYLLTLGAVAPRPAGIPPPNVEIALDGAILTHFSVGPDYQHIPIVVHVPLTSTAAPVLQIHSQTFTEPAATRRTLGIILTDVSLKPVRWPLIPPLAPLLAGIAEGLLLYSLLRLRLPWRPALITAAAALLAATAVFFALRLPFAVWADGAFYPAVCLAGGVWTGVLARRRGVHPVAALGAAVVVGLAAVSAAGFLQTLNGARYPTDFHIFYQAAMAVWSRQPQTLYDLQGIRADPLLGLVYRQPPTPAVLLAPLATLPFAVSLFLWRLFLVACVATAIGLLAREFRLHAIGTPRGWPLLALIALTLLWLPLRESMFGQWDAPLLVLLVLALIGLRHDRPPLVGITIAFAGIIKIYPLYLVLFLVWKREWRALGWLAGTFALFIGCGVVGAGWSSTALYLVRVFPHIGGSTTYGENQSLTALLLRLFQIEATHGRAVTLLTALSCAVVTLPLCALLRKTPARTSLRYAADFGVTIGAMLLAIPVAWLHYGVVLLVPLAILLASLALSPTPSYGWLLGIVCAVAVLTVGPDVLLRDFFRLPLGRHSYFDRVFVASGLVFAQLALALIVALARVRALRATSASPAPRT